MANGMNGTADRAPRRWPGRVARGRMAPRTDRARRGGQVLILTLVSMTLLVGLAFYAYNVGDAVSQRLEMQGAADAAAVSGAGWMARSMNVVAMNNVGMAKMLSLVPILDAQPLATKMALDEVTAWERGLAAQLARGVPATKGNHLEAGLSSLRQRMAEQRDILQPYNELLNGGSFSMEMTTTWAVQGAQGGPPHGSLWQAAVAMDEFSRAAVETCGVLAQSRAAAMGKLNGAQSAFLTPVLPVMPARLGQFDDFKPLLRGRLQVESDTASCLPIGGAGGAIPDFAFPHRLGPYARLHRWRDYITRFVQTGQQWVPGTPGVGQTRGGSGNVNLSGRSVGASARDSGSGSAGRWQATGYSEPIGYRAFGPYSWAMRHIADWANGTNENPGKLRDTYFYSYTNEIARIKLRYMFPDSGQGGAHVPTVSVHYPQWVTDYPQCAAIAADPLNRVTSTLFYVVEIASSVPEGSPGWLSPGSYRTNGDYPKAVWAPGWNDPGRWPVPKVADYVWKDNYTYETTEDAELGIRLTVDPATGEPVWHPVFMVVWYVFGGIDIGGEVPVTNPANWDQYDLLPVPTLLDLAQGDYTSDDPEEPEYRRKRFMYLGAARRDVSAPFWASQFAYANSTGGAVTVAQAKVFNHQSWDLWTQDWRACLAPVSGWDDWLRQMEEGQQAVGETPSITPEEIEKVLQCLSSLSPAVAEAYLSH